MVPAAAAAATGQCFGAVAEEMLGRLSPSTYRAGRQFALAPCVKVAGFGVVDRLDQESNVVEVTPPELQLSYLPL